MTQLAEQFASFENLYHAYQGARKGKRYRDEVLQFDKHLEENLLLLQKQLRDGTYAHGPYRSFVVHEAKKRNIQAAPFRDRVVHHAVYRILAPLFESGFIYDSYACRAGKGSHAAVKRLQTFLRSARDTSRAAGGSGRIYCLKCDISKYFASINHGVLLEIVKRKLTQYERRGGRADPRLMETIEKIVRSSEAQPGAGIPIGNLTSQLFANVYLNELDQYMKRARGVQYYIRYMDDFLVLSESKEALHALKEDMRTFLGDGLGTLKRRGGGLSLDLHPKKVHVFPADKGIDFLGYVVQAEYRTLRKDTVRRFARRARKQRAQALGKADEERWDKLYTGAQSWRAYAQFAKSHRIRRDLTRDLVVPLV